MTVRDIKREKTWVPILLGLDFLSYGFFDTYTKLARSQAAGISYFLDFPSVIQQFWNAHSYLLNPDELTLGHFQNFVNIISSFVIANNEAIIFCGFIICTFGLIIAMTRYYPAFISISYGVFAGVALIGFYEGLANIAAMYGLTFLGPNNGVSVVIMIPATGYGILKTYNVDIWGKLVTRYPGLFMGEKKDEELAPRHLTNEYSRDHHPEISNDLPEYKKVLKNLASGQYGNHSSPVYIQQVNNVAAQYHLDPAKVAYDAYALSRIEEAMAGEE